MRKSITKSVSVLVAAFLICIMLPMGVFADWNASDVITITVDVFDVSANQIYRNVGTDTITKGDQYIQSDHYRIPELSQFTSASYGRIQKVTGNWYGYYESANVGTNVVFSCNSDTARITYYVSYYGTAAEGGGSSGSGSETEGSGDYSMTYTVVYHSNYPDGTDYQQTFKYTIYAGYHIENTGRTVNIKSVSEAGFSAPSGYLVQNPQWNTQPDGSGSGAHNQLYVKHNSTTHLYAQWSEATVTPGQAYTITYMDGDVKVGEEIVAAGESTAIMDGPVKENFVFKGWAEQPDGAAVYMPFDTVTPEADMTLYAVWQSAQNPDEKTNEPGIEKEASAESAKPGDTIDFTLRSHVPDYLGDYLNAATPDEPALLKAARTRGTYLLAFHDQMDEALRFNDDVAVTVNGKPLSAELYTVSTEEIDRTFVLSMDLVAIYEAGGYFTLEQIEDCPAIVVTYSATLDENAGAGSYKNTAWTAYEDKESEKPSVDIDVYGISIFKYDQNQKDKGLAGAEFTLKAQDGAVIAEKLVSAEDGYITFEGLAAGVYTLTETKAPEGYIKSDAPITITLPDDADNVTKIAAVTFANSLIPHTGGAGTLAFTIVGLAFVGAAVVFFVVSRRKKTQHH